MTSQHPKAMTYTYTIRPQQVFHICEISASWTPLSVTGYKPVVRLGDKVVYQGPRVATEDEAHTLCQEAIASLRDTGSHLRAFHKGILCV